MVPVRLRWRATGFTLLELLVVLVVLGIAATGVGMALPDSDATALDREAARLVAMLEAARAESRATGTPMQWAATGTGHAFSAGDTRVGTTSRHAWLHPGTWAQVIGPAAAQHLTLGPEPVLPAQRLLLSVGASRTVIATDGLRPFALLPAATGQP